MKKIILIIFILAGILKMQAQCDKPYKSLTELNNDTTEFLAYNFISRADCYKGKTFDKVITDLSITPGRTFMISNSKFFLSIYSFAEIELRQISGNSQMFEPNSIIITFTEPVDKEIAMSLNRKDLNWSQDKYEFYKNRIIEDITVTLNEDGKHYFKYFKERKSIPYTDFSKLRSTGEDDEILYRRVDEIWY